ncbi:MAG: mechanosensitive ion channel family protein, partial [Gammaproteobacteria bacterium]|nr:mechanosensitive ion channel family protein [Gammaproteobacteria bacterium]
LINYTRDGLRRFAVTVGIDYNDDPLAACALLSDKLRTVEGVLDEPASGVVANGLLDAWMQLEVFYWINTFDDKNTVGQVQSRVVATVRETLLTSGYTVSANTVSNLALQSTSALEVSVN